MLIKNLKPSPIQESFPKLLHELNNSNSTVPAYVRFQRQSEDSCVLRNDLKQTKEMHFRKIYKKQLELPKYDLE